MAGKATLRDHFNTPVLAPSGVELKTVGDAFAYIDRLPPEALAQPEWQVAVRELKSAVAGPRSRMIFARMTLFRAIHRSTEPPVSSPSRAKKAGRNLRRKAR